MNASESAAQWLRSALREHPALLVSALYVAASVIGMFYSWAYLRRFGINVFNYAQISDFLLASLKEPLTWALVVAALLLVLGDNTMSRRVERRDTRWFRWYGSPRYRLINNFVALYIVLLFIYLFALFQAKETRAGEGKVVEVVFADTDMTATSLLLGTTGQFVFLFDAESNDVDIHPIENIHSISFTAPEPE